MRAAPRHALALYVLLSASCSDGSEGACTPPAVVTYSCAPLPPGELGCTGTPSLYASYRVPDPDAAYAAGCEVSFPVCHGFYPDSVASCRCYAGTADGGPQHLWVCPL